MLRDNLNLSDTIYALSSGRLPSAIAIVRISGPQSLAIAEQLFHPLHGGSKWNPQKKTQLGVLVDDHQKKIDEVLTLCFQNPHSYTGEDLIEFHCHGSVAIIERLFRTLENLGARPAHQGEFSYRAFLNGKMSDKELDTLGDVYLAQSSEDLSLIYERKDEALEKEISRLRDELISIQAVLDTSIDFSDEYSNVTSHVQEPLSKTIHSLKKVKQRYEHFKQGMSVPLVVLAGRTNAGKSSLFNLMLSRYRSIVDHEPGTTRDVVQEDLFFEHRKFRLSDTAGIRQQHGVVSTEKQGMDLGGQYLASCHFWILVVDGVAGLGDEDLELLKKYGKKPHFVVWNKSDEPLCQSIPDFLLKQAPCVLISAKTGDGLEKLWETVGLTLHQETSSFQEALPSGGQMQGICRAEAYAEKIAQALEDNGPAELMAEWSRLAIADLEKIVGHVDSEMVLDRVFKDFCIGK